MNNQKTTLELRVDALERSSNRWRAVAIASAVGLLLSAAAPNSSDLTVQSLLVKSPAGTASVRIGPTGIEVRNEGAEVLIKTDGLPVDGRASIDVRADGREGTLSSGRMALVNTRDQLYLEAKPDSVQMFFAKEESGLQLINRKSGSLIAVGAQKDNVRIRSTGVTAVVDGKESKFPAAR